MRLQKAIISMYHNRGLGIVTEYGCQEEKEMNVKCEHKSASSEQPKGEISREPGRWEAADCKGLARIQASCETVAPDLCNS